MKFTFISIIKTIIFLHLKSWFRIFFCKNEELDSTWSSRLQVDWKIKSVSFMIWLFFYQIFTTSVFKITKKKITPNGFTKIVINCVMCKFIFSLKYLFYSIPIRILWYTRLSSHESSWLHFWSREINKIWSLKPVAETS